MKKHYKKHQIKFCPLCGSDVITHLGNNVFLCGITDTNIEAWEKVTGDNKRCNRVFGTVHPVRELHDNTEHRRKIGERVTGLGGRDEAAISDQDHAVHRGTVAVQLPLPEV